MPSIYIVSTPFAPSPLSTTTISVGFWFGKLCLKEKKKRKKEREKGISRKEKREENGEDRLNSLGIQRVPVRLLEERPAFMEKESLKRGINSTKDSQWKRARCSLIINLGSFVYDACIFILIFFIDENERGQGLYITCRIADPSI